MQPPVYGSWHRDYAVVHVSHPRLSNREASEHVKLLSPCLIADASMELRSRIIVDFIPKHLENRGGH
jgi:hypothetical protein